MLCIEGKLTKQEPIVGHINVQATLKGSLKAQGGIKATLTCTEVISASLSSAKGIKATLTGIPVNAYFSFSCPIEYITSCYSLGGWDNNLGWDNDQGWKD